MELQPIGKVKRWRGKGLDTLEIGQDTLVLHPWQSQLKSWERRGLKQVVGKLYGGRFHTVIIRPRVRKSRPGPLQDITINF